MKFLNLKLVVASCIAVIYASPSFSQTKVVVVPLGSDDSVCTTRISEIQSLNTFFNHIDRSCEADEKVIAGGYRYSTFNTSSNCDVIASYPLDETTWRVTWGASNISECSSYSARTYAMCCK